MYCRKCGAQMADGARFCPSCGQAVLQVQSKVQNRTAETDWVRLVAAFANGTDEEKNNAFTALYHASYKQVFAHVQRYAQNDDATNDAVQNAYIACWSKIDQLDNATQFLPWIKRIAYNEFLMTVRRDSRIVDFGVKVDDDGNEAPAEEFLSDDMLPMPEDAYANEELHRLLLQSIDELSEGQRIILKGFYFENKQVQTLADELDIPLNTVKTHLARGRKNLAAKAASYANAYGLKLVPVAIIPLMATLAEQDVQACEIAASAAGGSSVLVKVMATVSGRLSAGAAAGTAGGAAGSAGAVGGSATGTAAGAATAATAGNTAAGSAAGAGSVATGAATASGIAVKAGIGVTVAALAAGGGYGVYRYVHQEPAAIVSEEPEEAEEPEEIMPETTEEPAEVIEEESPAVSAEDIAAAQELLGLYMTGERFIEAPGMAYYLCDIDPGMGGRAENPMFAIADLNGDGINELWVGDDDLGWNMNLLPSSDTEYWFDLGSISGYNKENGTYLSYDIGVTIYDQDGNEVMGAQEIYEEGIQMWNYSSDGEITDERSMTQAEYDAMIASYTAIGELVDAQPFTQENIDALSE